MVQENEQIKIQFFASGYCFSNQRIVNPTKKRAHIKFYAVWALIKIPNVGYVMFDSGYSHHFHNETKKFPDRLYRWATPVFLEENETAVSLLAFHNIEPSEIKFIVISHFHGDHIAGLKDFPNAKLICTESALFEVQQKEGFAAVRKGILKGLLPKDFYARVSILEHCCDDSYTDEFGLLHYKLFNQSELEFVLLEGHARGQIGFIYKSENQHLVFATDAAWDYEAFENQIPPMKVVKIFIDSWRKLIDTQEKLRKYKVANPNAEMLFTHCPKTLSYLSNHV